MTSEEYSNAIHGIIASGRGYQAILDLTGYLKTLNNNVDVVVREYRSEIQPVRKICIILTQRRMKS